MGSDRKSLASIHISVLLFGFAAVIGKMTDLPSLAVTFGRVACSSIFLYILLKVRNEEPVPRARRDLILMIAAGAVLAIHWSAFFQAVKASTVAVGVITFSTYPIFVTFLEPIFFKERIKAIGVIEALIMLFGVFLIVPEFRLGHEITAGVVWGMVGSVSYAVLSLMNRSFADRYSGSVICFTEQLSAAVLLLPFYVVLKPAMTLKNFGGILLLGIFCTAIAHTLFVSGLKRVKVQTAAIISGLEAVYGILLAMIFLGEVPGTREIVGGVIVLLVSLLSSLRTLMSAGKETSR